MNRHRLPRPLLLVALLGGLAACQGRGQPDVPGPADGAFQVVETSSTEPGATFLTTPALHEISDLRGVLSWGCATGRPLQVMLATTESDVRSVQWRTAAADWSEPAPWARAAKPTIYTPPLDVHLRMTAAAETASVLRLRLRAERRNYAIIFRVDGLTSALADLACAAPAPFAGAER